MVVLVCVEIVSPLPQSRFWSKDSIVLLRSNLKRGRKERRRRKKYCSIEKLENTVTKNIGNILLPLASLRSERSQWLTKKYLPPLHPFKKATPFARTFFFKYCPVFEIFSCFIFSYYWLYRDFQIFSAKTFFFIS